MSFKLCLSVLVLRDEFLMPDEMTKSFLYLFQLCKDAYHVTARHLPSTPKIDGPTVGTLGRGHGEDRDFHGEVTGGRNRIILIQHSKVD